jgi:DNA-binding CsgD family transcriptional regulator
MYAAAHPDRVSAVILISSTARLVAGPDYPHGLPELALRAAFDALVEGWGSGVGLDLMAPSMAGDARFRRWWATLQAAATSPEGLAAWLPMYLASDVRGILPQVMVPTLVLHRANDQVAPVEAGRDTASRIPGARYCELPGADHLFWVGDQTTVLTAIRSFLSASLDTASNHPASTGPAGSGPACSDSDGANAGIVETKVEVGDVEAGGPGARTSVTGRAGRSRPRPATGWGALTPTEINVVRLVVDGLTNKEIGQRLHVSPRTVQTHVAHIFDKLHLRRRSELAVMASHRLRHPSSWPTGDANVDPSASGPAAR